MDNKVLGCVNLVQYAGVVVQVDNIFKWIQLGLAIVCSIVLLGYRVWKWYKEAKKDGKITSEEVKTLVNENKDAVVDIIEKTTDLVEDIKNSKNDEK